ncbi:Mth938-like domain-containing protein [Tropicimonas sp. IMCC34043]|uniref:Mth938-like domain-containing protein n=1 Tax=Tropicimonas sp. IMCC34043 TaxID=2248760 RepID=UPI000E231C63|nr:Mth938-like domain-containing protein [Tropicimonas sp. IMCC34043]
MRINEVSFSGARHFEGYGPGFFRLGGEVREGHLLVSDAGVAAWGGYDDADAIVALASRIDFVLLGTGGEMGQIPAVLRRAVEAAGIGVEIMSTPSACRTYNVLLSEGRRVAAAVIAI